MPSDVPYSDSEREIAADLNRDPMSHEFGALSTGRLLGIAESVRFSAACQTDGLASGHRFGGMYFNSMVD